MDTFSKKIESLVISKNEMNLEFLVDELNTYWDCLVDGILELYQNGFDVIKFLSNSYDIEYLRKGAEYLSTFNQDVNKKTLYGCKNVLGMTTAQAYASDIFRKILRLVK